MFFRRPKPRQYKFEDRLSELRQLGFTVTEQSSGKARVSKLGCAAILEDEGLEHPKVNKAGLIVGDEIAELVHGGYQMFLITPTGNKRPALAQQLKALHAFEEDLREGLGMVSLYNVSLGTRADQHMYDRIEGRDAPPVKHPWDR